MLQWLFPSATLFTVLPAQGAQEKADVLYWPAGHSGKKIVSRSKFLEPNS